MIGLFPAIPEMWKKGYPVYFPAGRSLRANGALLVSASCKRGALGTVTILSEKGRDCAAALPGPRRTWSVYCSCEKIPAEPEDSVLRFSTRPGKTYENHLTEERKRS